MNTERVRRGVANVVLMLAAGVSISLPAQKPAERVLPIRTEALLAKLRTMPLPPKLRNVSVSPDGSKVIYEEVTSLPMGGTRRGFSGYWTGRDDDSTRATVWLQDVKSGRRFALPRISENASPFRVIEYPYAGLFGVELQPRWSKDGKQVAFLGHVADTYALNVWRTDVAAEPTRRMLPRVAIEGLSNPLVVDWQWRPDRDEIIIGLRGVSVQQRVARGAPDTAWRWSWSASQALAESRQRSWPPSMEDQLDPQRVVIVSLKSQSTRELRPGGAERAFLTNRYSRSGWEFDGPDAIIARHRNAKVDTIRNNLQMWALSTDSLFGPQIRDARGSVQLLDVQTGATTTLYDQNHGEVLAATRTRGDASVVMVEARPEMNTWPLESEWGVIHWIDRKKGIDLVMDTVPFRSHLFASDRSNVVYHYDETWSLLSEVDRSTRKRTPLNPAGLSVTSMNVSPDGGTIAAVMESVSSAPEVYLWTSRGQEWRKLTDFAAKYRDSTLGAMEHLTWRSKDNVFDVDGIVVKPPRFDSTKRYPLLVFLQGGVPTAHIRMENRFDPFISFAGPLALAFADAGYVSLFVNHRDTYFSNYAASKALIGHFGIQLDDVEAGVDALIAKGWVNAEQVGVTANSHGSDEMMYLLSHSKRYKAAMLNDGTVPLPELWLPAWAGLNERAFNSLTDNASRPVMRRLTGFDPVQRVWADPFDMRAPLLIRWSAANYTETRAPIDGWESSNAKISSGATEKLMYAYELNKVPIDVIVDRDGHGISNMTSLLEWHSRMLQWFDYFLLGKGPNPIPAMKSPLDYSKEDR